MVPVVRTDQVTRGLSRLTQLFKNQPNCQGFLKSLLVPFPEIESVAWAIINQRVLSNLVTMVAANQNTADQLDILGSLVGAPRQGRIDKAYLPAIQVRIRVNRSQGRAEDIIQVSNLLAPGSAYAEYQPATWMVTAPYGVDPTAAAQAPNLLGNTKAAGTRGIYVFSNYPQNQTLVWSNYGASSPPGFGDATTFSGNVYASAANCIST